METSSPTRFDIRSLPPIPLPGRVLMTTPAFFGVEYVINPHMEGHIGKVDSERARAQWDTLKDAYVSLGISVTVLDGAEDLPDMVFCANQTLPYRTPGGNQGVVLSRMHAPERREEVDYFARFFEDNGYEILRLDADTIGDFEGMGDALWHPGRYLLWGGYGYRTDRAVFDGLSERLGFPVLPLHLTDPDFYHLDTCLCPLDETTVLIYPDAFRPEGLELIHAHFDRVLEAPAGEARELFACNAHSPDGKNVIIQRGCTQTNQQLREAGYEVIEVDTDEFLKSGGSVFCMKLMFW
ncbi:MAG: amidinotransferase [Bacteroidetes bacterium]|nr:amidinotransferase [Bacteroidota bacterium]